MSLRGAECINRLAQQAIGNVNLPRNAAKGCWSSMSRRRLYWLFLVEVWELTWALWVLHYRRHVYETIPWWETQRRSNYGWWVLEARMDVKREAGDCVAFLAFLVDRL